MSDIAVKVREVGLRDGLQSISGFMPTATKQAWCQADYDAGVREIEASALVPASVVPQLADSEDVIRHALGLPGLCVSALVPNLKGAERGIALGVHKLMVVLSASEGHNRANVRRTTEESIEGVRRICELARSGGHRPIISAGIATAFGCTIDGSVDEGRVRGIAEALRAAGADEIGLADTVGYAAPAAVRRLFSAVRTDLGPDVPVVAHFHDTRGLGLANVAAALEAGVRYFDASLAGLGGCPFAPNASGNVVLEDVVFMLEALGMETGIDLDKLCTARDLIARTFPDEPLHGAFARAGYPKGFQRRSAAAVAA
jgi:hydroxymethylglutaryl-CoA lyase